MTCADSIGDGPRDASSVCNDATKAPSCRGWPERAENRRQTHGLRQTIVNEHRKPGTRAFQCDINPILYQARINRRGEPVVSQTFRTGGARSVAGN